MSKANFKQLILWAENTIQINKELIEETSRPLSKHEERFFKNNFEKLTLIKEYLIDYQKLADDYRALEQKYYLLKLQKMEVDSRFIFEEMKKEYRANRRKWKAKI